MSTPGDNSHSEAEHGTDHRARTAPKKTKKKDGPAGPSGDLLILFRVFLAEALDPAGRIDQLLLAGKERMTC